MYGLIWRVLPGPWPSKLILSVGLLAGACALLWLFAFPAISPHMPFNDGAVDVQGADAAAEGAGALPGGESPSASESPSESPEPSASESS
ncbi:hypothetical protein BJF83_22055 [Nocardiopsis sp. CNR-923]|uniref:hypothetical protein n=1 Tax=Nocardiopsis sp. CNR-923 TaxID=1904965 RepID=UPI000963DAAF|nr:hypothetical protein [Nocardiopsis sp. CNR-923]OLT25907.1 hypothetical protein BJF83_22055 [Nocardiopsis sp. CNR-923]